MDIAGFPLVAINPESQLARIRFWAFRTPVGLVKPREQQLAHPEEKPSATTERPLQTAAEIILASMRDVPPEIMATLPPDGASQHDHYIYGWPKRDV